MHIRPYQNSDASAIWAILEPVLREGETLARPRDLNRAQALAYWCDPSHQIFVAEDEGRVLGSYYLHPNHPGGGSHVANCGYTTDQAARSQGVARGLCQHSLQTARAQGFRAMQFNFVISSNTRAVKLWLGCGFEVVGRLPGAFQHPTLGFVDALVMFQTLV